MRKIVTTTLAILLLFGSALSAQITFDGTINETAYGSALSTSSGGPTPGFGAGHEINAFYVTGDDIYAYFAIAGNVQNGNRILLFIDSKTGGYTTGNFGRTVAPEGIDEFNSGTTFDTGFEPDYCMVIGTNFGQTNYFFNFFTLSGSGGGPDNYMGDSASGGSGSDESGIGANPANSNNTRGFEFRISKSALGYSGSGGIKVMAMYISDGGFLSNQFLNRANFGEGNYGSGAVNFGAAAPGPISISDAQLPISLTHFSATPKSDRIELNWATDSEQNNDYMAVEKSADALRWQELGRVAGAGTTTQPQSYSLTDEKPLPGLNYYRLRQVDFDGRFEYHKTIAVDFKSETGGLHLFPSPAKERLNVALPAPAEQDSELWLLDAQGRVLQRMVIPQGGTQGAFEVSALPEGVYFVRMAMGDVRSFRFVR